MSNAPALLIKLLNEAAMARSYGVSNNKGGWFSGYVVTINPKIESDNALILSFLSISAFS
jgi:hypothetical protein